MKDKIVVHVCSLLLRHPHITFQDTKSLNPHYFCAVGCRRKAFTNMLPHGS